MAGQIDDELNLAPAQLSTPGAAIGTNSPGTIVREAFFGYNEATPLDAFGNPNSNLGYTPWPSAIRITMVLHDTAGRFQQGREIQFVIDLPSP